MRIPCLSRHSRNRALVAGTARSFFSAIVVALLLAAPASRAVTINERQALIDFYVATGGSNWIDHSNWLGPDGTECTWVGVVCSAGPPPNNVVQLALNANNLTGSLPDLAGLTELQFLMLPNNHLSGVLPPLQGLTKLVAVNVRNNLLSGPFPAWNFFAPFTSIDIGNNAFSGPLPILILTPTLVSMKVDGNFFDGQLPNFSSNLTNFQEFVADQNQLSGAIPSLDGLSSLKVFSVAGNNLSGVIPSISATSALQTFDVSNNQLAGPLPTAYPATLKKFFASNNYLDGSMPSLASTQLQAYRIDGNAQVAGPVAGGPTANTLLAGLSALCPSGLLASSDNQINAQWDAATGHVPWDGNGACAQQPPNGSPDLRVTKTHAGNFTHGQTGATYSLIVSNDGAVATNGQVTVVDTLPASLTPTAMSGPGWTCSLATTSCVRADSSVFLAPGASYPAITLTVDVPAGAPASVTNLATVSGGGETNTSNDVAGDGTIIDPASVGPDLTLTKYHAGNFSQGQAGAVYSLIVHNVGGAVTSGTVTLSETLPPALMPKDMSGPGWSCSLATVSCTRSDALAAGASYPAVTLTVDVAPDAPAAVTNKAVVSGGGEANIADSVASDPTTIDAASTGADLTLTKTHAGNFSQGQTGAVYSLIVHNIGGAATSGPIIVSDSLPAELVATSMEGPGWLCAGATCSREDTLSSGDSFPAITLTVDVAPNAAPSATNTAAVSGGGETNAANDIASDPTAIDPASAGPDLALMKSHSGNFSRGQSGAVYSLIVHNVGGAATNGTVVVTDALPADLAISDLTGTGWTCTLVTRSCTRSDPLDAGASYPEVKVTVDVSSQAAATVVNGATVSGGGEANVFNDVADDYTTIGTLLAAQTIDFTSTPPADAVVGGPTYHATANATSGLPVALTIDGASAAVCTIDNGGVVTFIGEGTCTIDANQSGNPSYAPAPQQQQAFAVTSAGGTTPQSILFTSTAPVGAIVAGPGYHVTASADSGLPVVLTIDNASANVCVIDNGDVTFIGAGTCTIDANQGGDATWAAAPQAQQAFAVASAGGINSQLIHFTSTPPVNAVVGGPTYLATATSTAPLPVMLTIDGTSATVCTIDNGTVSFIGPGNCTIDANQGGDATYAPAPEVQQIVIVGSAAGTTPQFLHFTSVPPTHAIVSGPSYLASAVSTSPLQVVLAIDHASATVCTINNGVVSLIGAGTCTIDANQGGDAIYAPASQVQQSFIVYPAGGATTQSIQYTSTAPVGSMVGGPSYLATAIASSNLPVVLTINGTSATVCAINNGIVTFIGAGTCTINANQGGNAEFAAAPQVQQEFTVASASGGDSQWIQFDSTPPIGATVAGPSYSAVAEASSGLPVVLTIDTTFATVCTINNDMVSFIGAGTCTIDANQGGDINYAPAPEVQQSFSVAGADGVTAQTIQFTSIPPVSAAVGGSSYLALATASSNLPVVLTIDSTSGGACEINNGTVTFAGVGTCTIDANQGGDSTYAPAPQVQQSFPVASAGTPTVLCQLPRQVHAVGDAVSIDLSMLFAPPPGESLTYGASNVPPSLSIVGSLLSGTLHDSDVSPVPYASMLTATSVPDTITASENVEFEVLPTGEILLRNGFDGASPPPQLCQ